jgi:two-component system OmpR family sensor kinase
LSAEKKALKRFLLIYLFSTLFLVFVGECFYYKLAKNNLIKEEKLILKNQIFDFLNQNTMLMMRLRRNNFNIPKNMNIRIYFDNRLVFSNSPIKRVKVTYVEIKRWGRIKIIASSDFPKNKLFLIWKNLILFNIFFILFLFVFSVWLGKIFLYPMRKTINDLEGFIRDATHEMNTPISVILTNVELLEENKNIIRIKNAAIRLNKIFEDLKYVRLHHKRKKEIKYINLKKFLEKRIKLFEMLFKNKRLEIKTDLLNYKIQADEEDLSRIIDNLLSNAIKYSPNNSEIYITIKNNTLLIINKGNIKNIKKITDKFYRENSSEGGFGLGLYIVKKICNEYNWKLDIKNVKDKVVISINF